MKLLIEVSDKKKLYEDCVDGVILPLEGFAVQSSSYFTYEEIASIVSINQSLEVFVSINKNMFNKDIGPLKEMLLKLDKLKLKGIFFYDLSLLQLKKELDLSIPFVWNQTYMVNNYKTCNYYFSEGVLYALLSSEITLEEIKEISLKSNINLMVFVLGFPVVAFSKRKLISNYYKDLGKSSFEKLEVFDDLSKDSYELVENSDGTNFYLKMMVNGTSIIKDLYDADVSYIIMKDYGISNDLFYELLVDTKKYIEGNCQDSSYIYKYKKLGDNTGFFFKKTIYQVRQK